METIIGRIEKFTLTGYFIVNTNFRKPYSVTSLILMFFSFAGLGWIWEVLIHIIQDGMIINRGILLGPILPIYGVGALLILTFLRKWYERPIKLFGIIMLLCGAMEYITGTALERLFGVKWWDYSDMTFQIQGKVSLGGLLIFGIGGLFLVYLGAPALDKQFQKLSRKARNILCICLLSLFVGDLIYSLMNPNMGFGITT